MTRRNVVLLNSDKPWATAALQRRADVALSVICRPQYAHLYDGIPLACVSSLESVNEVAQAAIGLSRETPVDYLIAATEKSIAAAGWARSLLALPGLGAGDALAVVHKGVMKERLRNAGVPVAAARQAIGASDTRRAVQATGPSVMKPIFGSLSRDTFALSGPDEFDALLASGALDSLLAGPVLVEERITVHHEYHCEAVLRDGRTEYIAVSRYLEPAITMPKPYNASYFLDEATPVACAIRDIHEQCRRALGLRDGVTHLEVLYDGVSLRVGEIALRPGGLGIDRAWKHAFGIDLWDAFVGTQLREPGPAPASATRPPGFVGRTQLPHLPGLVDDIRSYPGVLDVLTPERSGTGNVEVHFRAADEGAVIAAMVALHARAGRENHSAAEDRFRAAPQPQEVRE
jgi:hypothetical protein